MGIYFGDKPAKRIWYGDRPVKAVYRGAQKVWPLNVWVGALVADSILSGNAVLARAVAGGLVSVSDIVANPSRLRGVTGDVIVGSVLAATAMRTKSATGAIVAQSDMQAAASILTQKFATGSLDAISAVLAAASRDRAVAAALLVSSAMSAPASRLRSVVAGTTAISAIANAPALRFREVSGGFSSAAALAADATVEAAAAVYSYIGKSSEIGTLTTSFNFGSFVFPSAGLALVGVGGRYISGVSNWNGLTIDGNAATKITPDLTGGTQPVAIYARALTAGGTFNVTGQTAANLYSASCFVAFITGGISATPADNDQFGSDGTSTTVSNTVDIAANSIVLNVSLFDHRATTMSYSALTEDDETTGLYYRMTFGHLEFASSQTGYGITSTANAAARRSMVTAVLDMTV